MSVRGGFLVIGVDERGKPTGMVTDAHACLFDEARLRPKAAEVAAGQLVSLMETRRASSAGLPSDHGGIRWDDVHVTDGASEDPVDQLGPRLRAARVSSGLTLRQLARDLGVSPSFVSQMERGKSQPSVATLYSMARLLNVSVDELFHPGSASEEHSRSPAAFGRDADDRAAGEQDHRRSSELGRWRFSDVAAPGATVVSDHAGRRLSHLRQGHRPRLIMDTGVVWEQLATSNDRNLDFLEITYPPGSSSTSDDRMMRHQGTEYGYILAGELEVGLEFETFTLRAGESMSLDSSRPHRFTNRGRVDARGIWAVHHCAVYHDGA